MTSGHSFRLDGKAALVTGASRGLGASIAETLRAAGASVVGTSRTAKSANKVAERLGTTPVVMDVTDVSSVREGVDEAASELGGLDILVNNAGLNIPQGIFEVDEESWDAVMNTNLKGGFFAAQAAARHMVDGEGGGRIINMGSQAGVVGIEERSAYGASKGGCYGAYQSARSGVGRVQCHGQTPLPRPSWLQSLPAPR